MVILIVVVAGILIPPIIHWIEQSSKQTVRQQKSTRAYSLAEAGIERGVWKLKSSVTAMGNAISGTIITDYDFDTTFSDISGGFYRIKFVPGPNAREVTILAEGKDASSQETRAIKAIYRNQTFPGALISEGDVIMDNAFQVQWGPILSHRNILINGSVSKTLYYPRKLAKGYVQSSDANYPRDVNGTLTPNTDGQEWWSDYEVPDIPVLDFAAFRAAAAATNTLNVYGCSARTPDAGHASKASYSTIAIATNNPDDPTNRVEVAPWWTTNCTSFLNTNHAHHFQDSIHHPAHLNNCIWYWDGDVEFTYNGNDTYGNGIEGHVIVKGNMTNSAGDNYSYVAVVPTNAWQEYQKTNLDTSAGNGGSECADEYPGDDGLKRSLNTYCIGLPGGSCPTPCNPRWINGPGPQMSDVGFHGLVYVEKNLTLYDTSDFAGVVWVKGNVDSSNLNSNESCLIYYDETLNLPTLNVVLVKVLWDEVPPSIATWN